MEADRFFRIGRKLEIAQNLKSCSKRKKLLEIREVAKKLPSNLWKALHQEDGCDRAVPYFRMTLAAIFSILNYVSIRRNICLNFRKFTRENKPLFWQK